MKEILEAVLKRVKPSQADRERLQLVANELIQRTNAACAKLGVKARAMLVGSAARGTWIRSERDIDIFILFPEEVSREELERNGLAVGRAVARGRGREQFAEHPYVTMRFKGFEVDLVPCCDIANPTKIRTAVDRSPHHQLYVSQRLTPKLADEVLLVKQFTSGIGTYGSDLKVRGFSGYLCELLVLHHGSFEKLVEAACRWRPGVVIDPQKSYPDEAEPRALFRGQPLILIDPVDPSRNVGAAVSMQNFVTFVRACQEFLREPRLEFFFPRKVKLLDARGLKEILKRRGTKLYCVAFRSPDVVPDILYPQLRKTERTLVTRLIQSGFQVVRSDVWGDSNSAILIELTTSKLPRVGERVGPPVPLEATGFIQKHLRSGRRLAGPFVDAAGRIVFELEREYTGARKVLERALSERTAFGRHVGEAIAKGYRILEGAELVKLLRDREFREFISDYLTRCLPWYRSAIDRNV